MTKENIENSDKGIRLNEGKVRMDLLEPFAIEKLAEVFTVGSLKYAPNNWLKGMDWSKITASLKRHLNQYEQGQDFDSETGLLHAAHIAWNAMALVSYYKFHPELDDRQQWYKKPLKKLWLDLDGVLVDFEKYFLEYLNLSKESPTDWNDFRFRENFDKIKGDNSFWLNCPKLINAEEIDYPIEGYCTARNNCPKEIIEQWLKNNGFPQAKLINVGNNKKSDALKGLCDIMIDDSITNFIDLNSNGITCFLKTRPHNLKYNAGHLRVDSIKEAIEKMK